MIILIKGVRVTDQLFVRNKKGIFPTTLFTSQQIMDESKILMGGGGQMLKILEWILKYFYNPGASVWVFLSMSRKYKLIQDALLIIM